MKNAIALAAVAGIAGAASAQTATISLVPTTTSVGAAGTTVTVSVVADYAGFPFNPFQSFGSGLFLSVFQVGNDTGAAQSNAALGSAWSTQGFPIDATDASDIGAGLLSANVTSTVASIPLGAASTHELFTFDITVDATTNLTVAGPDGVDLFHAWAANGDLTSAAQIQTAFQGARITVIPTPGAAAVLGLGGLVAARRRR